MEEEKEKEKEKETEDCKPKEPPKDPQTRVRQSDALDDEYRYYSKLLKNTLILLLPMETDRKFILPWIHKLSSTAYNVKNLREKRNRYMLLLCMAVLFNFIVEPFTSAPPIGALLEVKQIVPRSRLTFEWETDPLWEEQLAMLNEIEEKCDTEGKAPLQRCYLHANSCPKDSKCNRSIGKMLDRQFRFLLYICKPYAAMLHRASDRVRTARWIQILCSVEPKNYCSVAKGVRNDYMTVLCGYLANQTLVGPFDNYPLDKLIPITELLTIKNDYRCIIDPTHPKNAEFFQNVPRPTEGAFAYIAVTGDLYCPNTTNT